MLAKFRAGEFSRVCNTGHLLPFFIRYAARRKYDGIWLDLEHRTMDQREVQLLLNLCYHNDIDCMVRPSTQEAGPLYRYLEEGATGFMMPLVSNADTARRIVRAVKFPPLGNRGLDGASLDGDYGLEVWKPDTTYCKDANRETFIVVQIETLEALENINQIAEVEGIDGLFIGPADLTFRLSIGADSGKKVMSFDDAVKQVANAAKRYDRIWGIATTSLDDLKRYRKMGAQLVPWGGDFALSLMLNQWCEQLDEILAEPV